MYLVYFFCCCLFLFMVGLHLGKYSMYVCDSHRYQEGIQDILKMELLTKQLYRS